MAVEGCDGRSALMACRITTVRGFLIESGRGGLYALRCTLSRVPARPTIRHTDCVWSGGLNLERLL